MVSHDPGKKVSCNAPKRHLVRSLTKKNTKKRHKTATSVSSARPTVSFSPTLKNGKNKNVKKETSLQPKKSKKEKKQVVEGKKHRRNFIKKVVVWAFLSPFEKGTGRGKQMEDEERKKEVCKDRKMLFWGKIVAERSPACLRRLGSCAAEQEHS